MEDLDLIMSSEMAWTEGRTKVENVVRQDEMGAEESTPETAAPDEVSCWWMSEILDVKKDMSELQKSVDCMWWARESGGFVILLSREKRVFEFC